MNFGDNLSPYYTLVLAADDKVHLSINKNTLNQDHSCRKDTTDRRPARKELRSRTVKTMQLPSQDSILKSPSLKLGQHVTRAEPLGLVLLTQKHTVSAPLVDL
ncbi:hypothetical protein RRG08_040539 [Elysia crispata]|uniref:Uncharacterized protein n=1 Tax=Elysia crispata TaxID=231223 RepID=A0AAE0Z4K6_9GAST|nr:hypothetical protein RRG08_040539 [Elysia crispata]